MSPTLTCKLTKTLRISEGLILHGFMHFQMGLKVVLGIFVVTSIILSCADAQKLFFKSFRGEQKSKEVSVKL